QEMLKAQQQAVESDASCAEQLSRLEQRELELKVQLARFQEDRQQFIAEQSAWHEERRQLDAKLEQQVESIDKAQSHVDEDRQKLEQERRTLEQERRKLDELIAATDGRKADAQPRSTADLTTPLAALSVEENKSRTVHGQDDVFAQLRAISLTKDLPDQPESIPDLAAPARHAHEHEESIEDYMVRLLQRVRGINVDVEQAKP